MTTYETLKDAERAVGGAHARIVCTCGVELQNCRCFSHDKTTVAVRNGCEVCSKKGK